jgi:signal transduction histidine kinase
LDVADNGVGFDSGAAGASAQDGHFGLRGLTDRVADAGGVVQVLSAPSEGTRVLVKVPLR